MFVDSTGVFTCSLFIMSLQYFLVFIYSSLQLLMFAYLYAVSWHSSSESASPSINDIFLVTNASKVTFIAIAIIPFSE